METKVPNQMMGIVNAKCGLNFRKEAKKNAGILRILPHLEVVTIKKQARNWLEIEDENGTTGYVMAQFINKIAMPAAEPEAPIAPDVSSVKTPAPAAETEAATPDVDPEKTAADEINEGAEA